MNTTYEESQDFYKMIKQNRLAMYSNPKRYYNRDGQNGSAFKFLFLIEAIVFILMTLTVTSGFAQQNDPNQMLLANTTSPGTICNYTTVYNSGKVFLNWTAKNEPADCIYIIERSGDAKDFQSVGVKEGIGTAIELFYSWMDEAPPAGFAYYRVKKIAKDGNQFYSQVNAVINQGSSYNPKTNYAQENTKKAVPTKQ
ncbi:MAG TPA: hypothetical protein VJY62_09700 [Bacteroidia bacterium]|nr:hypothetical protein [Bacteroidia bacterium]